MGMKEWEWYEKILEGARSFYIDLGGILVEVDEKTAKDYLRQRLSTPSDEDEGGQ